MNEENLKIWKVKAEVDECLEAVYKFPKWMTGEQILEYFRSEGANGEFETTIKSWRWKEAIQIHKTVAAEKFHTIWTPNFELIEEKFNPTQERLEEEVDERLSEMCIDEFLDCLEDVDKSASSVFDEYYKQVKDALVKQLSDSYEMARKISPETATAINMAEDTLRKEL
tara:strand:+ start:217 stop:723 length:507 start_codon:yes stop_codon:yes gene_type:complete